MKKIIILVIVVAVIFSGILISVGCGEKTATEGAGKGVVYYLAPTLFDEFQAGSKLMAEKFGAEMGYEVKSLNANNSADKQITQFADIIPLKPKAIILNAVDSATIVGSVDDARNAGIGVLVYDRFITGTKVDFHSVVGTIKMGNMAADEVIRLLKEKYGEEKGVVLEIMGDPGDQYTVLIDQGFQDSLGAYPNIEVIAKDTPGWEPTIGANIVEDQISARKDIDIIFCHSDGRIGAITPVLEAQKYAKGDITLIGTDGAPSGLDIIRDGWMLETIAVPMQEQAYAIWQFMADVIAKKELKAGEVDIKGIKAEMKIETWGPTLYLPGQILNKDNIDNPNLWGNLKVEVEE
jgi:ribose transport system substrate-binding protein